jgi:Flp pilus assembly protein TadG
MNAAFTWANARYETEMLPSRDDGSSAVEFAILAPVFLLLVFGMIAYAIYFGTAHYIQQITADAARASIAGLDNEERESIVEQYVASAAQGYFLDPHRLDFRAQEDQHNPDRFIVRVSYDATALPIWNLYPPIPLPSKTITATSTIRKGGW